MEKLNVDTSEFKNYLHENLFQIDVCSVGVR